MQFIKKLLRGLSAFAFKFLIMVLAIVSALVMTFNSPHKIEKSLSDSGVYSTFISSALKEVQKSNNKNNSQDKSSKNDIPIDDPAVVDAANQAFTPQLLQSTTENVLNGTYDWLSGKAAKPSFTINFADAKQTFAQKVGQAAQKRLAGLPKCTPAQAKQQGSDIDAFSATCAPKSLNIKAAAQKVTDDLAHSKDFLGTPVMKADNLSKDKNGQTVFDRLAKAPKVYKAINASPWLLACLAGLAGLVTFLLYDSKRRGLRNLAISLAVAGTFLLLITYAVTKGFDALNKPSGKLGESFKDSSFQQTIIKGLDSLSGSIEHVLLWFGIAYLVIGAGTLITLHFTKPKKTAGEIGKNAAKPEPDSQESSSESPKTDQKPAPKPKTIQG
ncbi:MAG: hypothetical protein ACXWLH_03745 [Candidatus Saccharimonadales bacterium]